MHTGAEREKEIDLKLAIKGAPSMRVLYISLWVLKI